MKSGLPLVGQRMLISSLIECPLRKSDLEDPWIISHAPLTLRLLQPGVIRGEFVLHPIPAMLKGICIQGIDSDQVRRFLSIATMIGANHSPVISFRPLW